MRAERRLACAVILQVWRDRDARFLLGGRWLPFWAALAGIDAGRIGETAREELGLGEVELKPESEPKPEPQGAPRRRGPAKRAASEMKWGREVLSELAKGPLTVKGAAERMAGDDPDPLQIHKVLERLVEEGAAARRVRPGRAGEYEYRLVEQETESEPEAAPQPEIIPVEEGTMSDEQLEVLIEEKIERAKAEVASAEARLIELNKLTEDLAAELGCLRRARQVRNKYATETASGRPVPLVKGKRTGGGPSPDHKWDAPILKALADGGLRLATILERLGLPRSDNMRIYVALRSMERRNLLERQRVGRAYVWSRCEVLTEKTA